MSATSFVYHNRDALSRTTPISVAHSMGLHRSREPQLKREIRRMRHAWSSSPAVW
jgi:hypothetical protein